VSIFSYTGSALSNLVGNTPGANVSNLVTMYNDIKTFLNGANLDGTNIAATYVEPAFSSYKTFKERGATTPATNVTSGGVVYTIASPGVTASAANGAAAMNGMFYFDPADFTASGRSTKLRLRATYVPNGTQTGQTSTLGLYPVTAVTNGAVTVGTVTSGSTVAFANPAINTLNQNNSGDFTAPAAGFYTVAFATGAAWTVGSIVEMIAELQVRQV
jgi:hypothetical protein